MTRGHREGGRSPEATRRGEMKAKGGRNGPEVSVAGEVPLAAANATRDQPGAWRRVLPVNWREGDSLGPAPDVTDGREGTAPRRHGDAGMADIRSFKELRVWQNAMDAAMAVYEQSKTFPPTERYALTDQFRRATRSVAANIAEAWRKRRYAAAFVSQLNAAEGEAAEAQCWVEICRRCGYLRPEQVVELDERFMQILGQPVRMIENPADWVVGRHRRVSASPCRRVRAAGHGLGGRARSGEPDNARLI